jgi:hypothetical protein
MRRKNDQRARIPSRYATRKVESGKVIAKDEIHPTNLTPSGMIETLTTNASQAGGAFHPIYHHRPAPPANFPPHNLANSPE